MNVKKFLGTTLLTAGLMLTVFTSCESEDVKNEKKFDGEWSISSIRQQELMNGEIVEGYDTTFYGAAAMAYSPVSRIVFYKDGNEAYFAGGMMGGNGPTAQKFTYKVMGDKLFLTLYESDELIVVDIESLSDTEIVVSTIQYEYYSYNDAETVDEDNPVYDLYQYKATMTFTKQ